MFLHTPICKTRKTRSFPVETKVGQDAKDSEDLVNALNEALDAIDLMILSLRPSQEKITKNLWNYSLALARCLQNASEDKTKLKKIWSETILSQL